MQTRLSRALETLALRGDSRHFEVLPPSSFMRSFAPAVLLHLDCKDLLNRIQLGTKPTEPPA